MTGPRDVQRKRRNKRRMRDRLRACHGLALRQIHQLLRERGMIPPTRIRRLGTVTAVGSDTVTFRLEPDDE